MKAMIMFLTHATRIAKVGGGPVEPRRPQLGRSRCPRARSDDFTSTRTRDHQRACAMSRLEFDTGTCLTDPCGSTGHKLSSGERITDLTNSACMHGTAVRSLG
eukprot:3265397-Prymnesium_polylepis.2